MRFIRFRRLWPGLRSLLPLGLASLLIVGLSDLGLFTSLAETEYQLRFHLRGPRPWAEEIVLIAIDDSSLATLGAFPWPRRRYAELLQQLQAASPEVIVFNILMSETSPDDDRLAAAIAAQPAVILASAWDREGRPLRPTPTLAEVSLTSGHILQQQQGWNRQSVQPMLAGQPALSIAVAKALRLTQRDVSLPSLDDRLWVNWPGKSGQLTTYSFVDVLEGRFSPHDFRHKVVLIGATALGLDDWVSPFDADPPASGVHLHAALIDNLLHHRWLVPMSSSWSWLGAISLGLGLQGLMLRRPLAQQATGWVGLLIAWWGLALGLFRVNWWLPVIGPALLFVSMGSLSISQQGLQRNRWLQRQIVRLKHRYFSDLLLSPPDGVDQFSPWQQQPFQTENVSGLEQLLELTQQLGRSQAIQAAIARSLPMGLIAVGMDGIVWFANPLAMTWLKLSAGDNLATALVPAWLTQTAWTHLWENATKGQPISMQIQRNEFWYELRLESLVADTKRPAAWPQGAILLIEDISYRQSIETRLRLLNHNLEAQVQARTYQLEELNRSLQEQIAERQQAQSRLTYEALHDPLTGLPNRRQFLLQLSQKLAQPRDELFAVLFLDCDRFKLINDSFGHWVGDELLKQVATIVGECVRPADVIARFGGDEFTVLLGTLEHASDAISIAQRIRQRFTQSLQIAQHQLFTNTSIGIVIGGPYYHHPDEVLRDADTAMYQAKVNGLGYALFEPGMHLEVRRSLQIETALRLALERQEFQLYYQPILALNTHQLMGCEALLRWQHPERGVLFPHEFVAIAEDTGLMIPIGHWVLQEACSQMQTWRQHNLIAPEATICINLSATQFLQADFIGQINRILDTSELPAVNLKLEITETVVIQNPEQVVKTIQALRGRGIRMSIDDFGTGYSSLGYLQQLPVDMLKIDRSFISDIHQSHHQYGIVEAIVRLANHLKMQVIAEGIDQASQLELLNQLGCQFGQGYLFSRPLSVNQFSDYLRSRG